MNLKYLCNKIKAFSDNIINLMQQKLTFDNLSLNFLFLIKNITYANFPT